MNKTTTTTVTTKAAKTSKPKIAEIVVRTPKRNRKQRERKVPILVADKIAHDVTADIEQSVAKKVQTLFFPRTGIHRGEAMGVEETALTSIKGSLDVQLASTSPYVTFSFQPSLLRSATMGVIKANIANFGDPYSTPLASIPGPFVTTYPGGAFRTVSFALTITPSGALLTQAGEGALAIPTSYSSIDWTDTRTSIDNVVMQKSWDGRRGMTLHWVPNEHDIEFDTSHTSDSPITALVGYFQIPAGATAVGFRFSWEFGIEYIPNNAYKSYVTRLPPELHPNTLYYLNRIVTKKWSQYCICETDLYNVLEAKYQPAHKSPGYATGGGSLGSVGVGYGSFDPAAIGNIEQSTGKKINLNAKKKFDMTEDMSLPVVRESEEQPDEYQGWVNYELGNKYSNKNSYSYVPTVHEGKTKINGREVHQEEVKQHEPRVVGKGEAKPSKIAHIRRAAPVTPQPSFTHRPFLEEIKKVGKDVENVVVQDGVEIITAPGKEVGDIVNTVTNDSIDYVVNDVLGRGEPVKNDDGHPEVLSVSSEFVEMDPSDVRSIKYGDTFVDVPFYDPQMLREALALYTQQNKQAIEALERSQTMKFEGDLQAVKQQNRIDNIPFWNKSKRKADL